jgi:hypothetical protein
VSVSRPRALLLSLLCGPALPVVKPLPPRARPLSLRRGPALSALRSPCPPWTSARALVHVAGNLGHVVRPRVPALFEHRPHPHSLPRLISRSPALASALPTLFDLARDPRPPPRSSSSLEATPSDPELRLEVRTSIPALVFPYSRLPIANLASPACGRACSARPHGVRPARPRPVPRYWPIMLPHLHWNYPKPYRGRLPLLAAEIPHRSYLVPLGAFLPPVSPSLTPVSWPQPCHRVPRVVFSISNQLQRPQNRDSTHPPQLRRLHRREEDRRRPQPFTPSRFDLPRPILIARPRSRDTASRTRALRPDPPVSACVP